MKTNGIMQHCQECEDVNMNERLKKASENFLVKEFTIPFETTKEDDMAMFDYRQRLVEIAYYILGGVGEGEHNIEVEKEEVNVIDSDT